ncbi:MAG: hypothetical protein LUG52_02810 [Clostridia bacterium]|nr:hypothetical protein [Clostridia bacterium]
MAEELNTLTGTVSIPLHGNDGKSAYEVACDLGYTGTAEEWLSRLIKNDNRVWNAESDIVSSPKTGEVNAPLSDFETQTYEGDLFLVSGDSDTAAFDTAKYEIHGSNGYLNVGDYIIRLNGTWVRLNLYEAKASSLVNSDGKYSPSSGVDGLFSSTQAAYLTDLINTYWGKEKLQIYTSPDPEEGWLINWCTDNAIYLGGFKPDCSGHPPILNDNNTSWVLLNLNGMRMSENDEYYNHRLQLAFDLVNNLIYMRRGWISSHEFTDWVKVGDISEGSITTALLADESVTGEKIADGSISEEKLAEDVLGRITSAEEAADDAKKYVYLPDTDGNLHKGTLEVKDGVPTFIYEE